MSNSTNRVCAGPCSHSAQAALLREAAILVFRLNVFSLPWVCAILTRDHQINTTSRSWHLGEQFSTLGDNVHFRIGVIDTVIGGQVIKKKSAARNARTAGPKRAPWLDATRRPEKLLGRCFSVTISVAPNPPAADVATVRVFTVLAGQEAACTP